MLGRREGIGKAGLVLRDRHGGAPDVAAIDPDGIEDGGLARVPAADLVGEKLTDGGQGGAEGGIVSVEIARGSEVGFVVAAKGLPAGVGICKFTRDTGLTLLPDPDNLGGVDDFLRGSDGTFYGLNSYVGSTMGGAISQMTADDTVTLFASLDLSDPQGGDPFFTQGSDGNFYGNARSTFTYAAGLVFKVTAAGQYSVLAPFNTGMPALGLNPDGGVTEGLDGNFYGTTIMGGAHGAGTVFQVTPDGSLTKVTSLTAPAAYYSFFPRLLRASDGSFYGTRGITQEAVVKPIFNVTPGGVLTDYDSAQHFTAVGPLTMASDGYIYGMGYGEGDRALTEGVIFRFTSSPPQPDAFSPLTARPERS